MTPALRRLLAAVRAHDEWGAKPTRSMAECQAAGLIRGELMLAWHAFRDSGECEIPDAWTPADRALPRENEQLEVDWRRVS